MRDYIDITGKSEEEAIEKALGQLGLDRDEVSVEILERAKTGFLGIGRTDAKVRIRYGEEKPDLAEDAPEGGEASPPSAVRQNGQPDRDKQPRKEQSAQQGKAAKKAAPKQKKGKANQPAPSAQGQSAPIDQSQPPEPSAQSGQSQSAQPDQSAQPASPQPTQQKKAPKVHVSPVYPTEEVDDAKSRAIKTYLGGLLECMEVEAKIKVYLTDNVRYRVVMEGAEVGTLIGRRGETLDAIQQITSYTINRMTSGPRARIQLDAEGYRERREESLRNIARREAAKVIKLRRSRTLEPMNAYERHVIHAELQDYRGVSTYSTGIEPNRRVVVTYHRESL